MHIRFEIDETMRDDEVVVRAKTAEGETGRLVKAMEAAAEAGRELLCCRDGTKRYLPLADILFFETEGDTVYAHTRDDMFASKYRLYELEELLPHNFMRVSKSAVLNLAAVCSLTRSLPSACTVQLLDTHKQVYVSRYYYKLLRQRLEEKRR